MRFRRPTRLDAITEVRKHGYIEQLVASNSVYNVNPIVLNQTSN